MLHVTFLCNGTRWPLFLLFTSQLTVLINSQNTKHMIKITCHLFYQLYLCFILSILGRLDCSAAIQKFLARALSVYLTHILLHYHQLFFETQREYTLCPSTCVLLVEILAMINLYYLFPNQDKQKLHILPYLCHVRLVLSSITEPK